MGILGVLCIGFRVYVTMVCIEKEEPDAHIPHSSGYGSLQTTSISAVPSGRWGGVGGWGLGLNSLKFSKPYKCIK